MKCEIKYAPRNLNDVIYPNIVTERTIKGYANSHLEGHLMLHGPNGTGKTTVANLLIEAIGGEDAIVEERACDEIMAMKDLRGYLDRAGSMARFTTSKKHFLLLEEFDNFNKGAYKLWTALDYCGDKVMAIFTTNKPMEIDRSIRSRTDIIEFPAVSASVALARIQYVLNCENIYLPDAQVLTYLKYVESHSDIRKYMREADRLIHAVNTGIELPAWSRDKTSLQLV